MTIPGLALFYGGLVRSKNMLSVLMQVFVVSSLIYVLWVVYGYSAGFWWRRCVHRHAGQAVPQGRVTPDFAWPLPSARVW
jgi:ammonia channel protein AmtB